MRSLPCWEKGKKGKGMTRTVGEGLSFSSDRRTTLETDCHGKHLSMYLTTADTDVMAHKSISQFVHIYATGLGLLRESSETPIFKDKTGMEKKKRSVKENSHAGPHCSPILSLKGAPKQSGPSLILAGKAKGREV